ncbi:MAG: hypothetical protein O7F14_07820 [Alphaproteobacteria bacterium]|nr:hypothetical protein [Alphaproteobacteria bacterium]
MFEALEDFNWREDGQATFGGNLLALYQRLDRRFLKLAEDCAAKEYRFPSHLPAEILAKIDYFHGFPQLMTLPAVLAPAEENIESFRKDCELKDGAIPVTELAPIKHVLTPAACYHFYPYFEGENLDATLYLTTHAICHRHEEYYEPLQRQWNFGMREIVCIGTSDEVQAFLESYEAKANELVGAIGIEIVWEDATDPFFNPTQNPKFLAQKLDPVKKEMVFEGSLAIGSTNFHRNYFGEAFSIKAGGEDAFSGCIAFGLERWMYAILKQFGTSPESWPG